MADEIRSIYEHLKDDKMATLSDYAGAKTYAFKSSGVREKILEINREENRLPTDHTHIGLERYCYAQSPILTVADALKVVGKQISPLAREERISGRSDSKLRFRSFLLPCSWRALRSL